MIQAIMTAPGRIEYRDVPQPDELGAKEVLFRIRKIGICGSDIHVYHGEHPAVIYPVVQGHEYSAEVTAVGEKVKDIQPGMRATARPQLVCGVCGPCRRGQYNVCQNLKVQGFQAPGVAQEYFVVPEDRVLAFGEEISFEKGAMIEPLAVAVHAVSRVGSVSGKNVVVSGAGIIGNLVAQQAKLQGAKKVLVTDLSDYRIALAKQCGVDGGVNGRDKNFTKDVKEFFGSEGFQVGLEAAGAESSLSFLMENVEKGGQVVIIGVYAKNPVVNMYFLGEHELNVLGSMMYRQEDYVAAFEQIRRDQVKLEPLMSRHFSFREFPQAYRYIEENREKTMKVFIDL